MMKTILFAVLSVLVGIVSAAATDMFILQMMNWEIGDVTGNYFLLGILPAGIVVAGVAALLLYVPFTSQPRNMLIYALAYCGGLYLTLMVFLGPNPIPLLMKYWAGALLGCGLWFFVLRRLQARKQTVAAT